MYAIRHVHFRVRAEKVDKKMICGRKCLPASDLKSSIHLAYHKKNGEMLLTMVDKNTFTREEIP